MEGDHSLFKLPYYWGDGPPSPQIVSPDEDQVQNVGIAINFICKTE